MTPIQTPLSRLVETTRPICQYSIQEGINQTALDHNRPPLSHTKHPSVLTQLFVNVQRAETTQNPPLSNWLFKTPQRLRISLVAAEEAVAIASPAELWQATVYQNSLSVLPPSVIFAFFPCDSPTQREAARSEGEALRQTEAQAGGQKAIDGQHIDRDPERHLQWTGRIRKKETKEVGKKRWATWASIH